MFTFRGLICMICIIIHKYNIVALLVRKEKLVCTVFYLCFRRASRGTLDPIHLKLVDATEQLFLFFYSYLTSIYNHMVMTDLLCCGTSGVLR